MEYFDLALEHAWKVHACLPIKNLSKGGRAISPYECFFGVKPCIKKLRVLFCPCVMNTGPHEDKLYGGTTTRKNSPERGIRGVHVGVPRGTAGWLVYVPSTSQISISQDVLFDEDFLSTVVYSQSRIPGGIKYQPPCSSTFHDEDLQSTENPA